MEKPLNTATTYFSNLLSGETRTAARATIIATISPIGPCESLNTPQRTLVTIQAITAHPLSVPKLANVKN